MKKLLFFLIVFCLGFLFISCSGGGGGGGASGESLDELISDDDDDTSSSSNTAPSCPLSSTYTLDSSSTADNTSITDSSSITDNSDVDKSTVRVCSTIISARVDNSTVDNSTIIGSTATNSTLDNSTVYATSTIDNASVTNSTITNSIIDNSSTITNSIIRDSNIDNSTIINMTIIGGSVVVNNPLENDNLSGFNSSDEPTVTAIKIVKEGSLVNAAGLSQADDDTNIYIYFSEAMDITSITAITSGTTCSGTFRLSSNNFTSCLPMTSSPADQNSTNKIFTFNPKTNLVDATVHRIIVTTGVKDASGIAMEDNNTSVSGSNGFTVSK